MNKCIQEIIKLKKLNQELVEVLDRLLNNEGDCTSRKIAEKALKSAKGKK